jgi:type IV secretion system protein VirD4
MKIILLTGGRSMLILSRLCQGGAMFTTRFPFLGFSMPQSEFGLRRPRTREASTPVLHEGKAHLLSIGQTGSGKTNLMIANLLLWGGSAIVVDIRGDAMRATAAWRRKVLGQKVYVLDPFARGGSPHRLDPLQVITLPRTEVDAEAQTIASVFAAPFRNDRDPYWHINGSSLLGGLCCHFMSQKCPGELSMNNVTNLVFHTDVEMALATMMDQKIIASDSFQSESLGAFLELPDGNGCTRSCVLSMARSMLEPFRCRAVQTAMGSPTVNLNLLLKGKPVTIYLVLPIERLVSHSMVLSMWIELICQTLLRRTVPPDLPTLLFVDECAQVGFASAALKMIAVYMRGQGVKLWSFFQDFGQIKTMFGNDQSTFVNSNSAITLLPGTGMAARELAATLAVPQQQVENLADNEQLVYEVGKGTRTVRMAQYWREEMFRGRFQPIPRFSVPGQKAPRRQKINTRPEIQAIGR